MKKKKEEEFVETSPEIKTLEKKKKGVINIDFTNLNEKEKPLKKKGRKIRTKAKKTIVELPIKVLNEEKSEVKEKPKEIPLSELPYIEPKVAKEIEVIKPIQETKQLSVKELKKDFKLKKKLLKQQKKEEKLKKKIEEKLKKQTIKEQTKIKQIEIPLKEEKIQEEDTNRIKQITLIPLGCQIIKICPVCNSKMKKKKLKREMDNLKQKIICKKCGFAKELNFEV